MFIIYHSFTNKKVIMYLIYSKINKYNKDDNYLSIKCTGCLRLLRSLLRPTCPTSKMNNLVCILLVK